MTPRLLIITQIMDTEDTTLSFFHNWTKKFAEHFPQIVLIALKVGKYDLLPSNVKVFSLGKETGRSRIKYIFNFIRYIVRNRRDYDAVFVHMNQEYVLLAGWLWFLLGKRVYMWRNHHAGSYLTDIAAMFCKKVFCTSRFSYTAKYKKTVFMPIGIDIDKFRVDQKIGRVRSSILFLGRVAPSKNQHIFIETLGLLKKKGIQFSASLYGDALPENQDYCEKLQLRVKELGLDNVLIFPGVPNSETPKIYNSHEIFVNLSSSGMYDKTIFEAMACGALTLASNENLRGNIDGRMILEERTPEHAAKKLVEVFRLVSVDKEKIRNEEIKFAQTQSLDALSEKLCEIMCVI